MKKVRLLKPHTHLSKTYQPNEVISVSPFAADWLVLQNIGEYVEQKSSIKKAAKTAEQGSTAQSDAVGEA
ncbi:TPA: hypothetical protein ACHWKL_003602 [Providencia stuartii]|uniref:DUF7210 family protein n=1 Tax=Providencia TaxID=586 RepID=UPI00140BE327|nr:hypothetical protein [Providencia stuartii]